MRAIDKLRMKMKNVSKTTTDYKLPIDEVKILLSEFDALEKTIQDMSTTEASLEKQIKQLNIQLDLEKNKSQKPLVNQGSVEPAIVRYLDGGSF